MNLTTFKWPKYNDKLLIEDTIPYVIQINGKKRAIINSKRDILDEDLLKMIYQNENLKKYLFEKDIKKKIFIPNRLINIIV